MSKELKKNEGPTLLRESSNIFLVICAIAWVAGSVYGVNELLEDNLIGILYICISFPALVFGFLIRGSALCLAGIAEAKERKGDL